MYTAVRYTVKKSRCVQINKFKQLSATLNFIYKTPLLMSRQVALGYPTAYKDRHDGYLYNVCIICMHVQ